MNPVWVVWAYTDVDTSPTIADAITPLQTAFVMTPLQFLPNPGMNFNVFLSCQNVYTLRHITICDELYMTLTSKHFKPSPFLASSPF